MRDRREREGKNESDKRIEGEASTKVARGEGGREKGREREVRQTG